MRISKCFHQYQSSGFYLDTEPIFLVDNQINFLLGDNGCGKSSLFKKIILDEVQCDAQSKIMMLQKPYLFNRTVLENIMIVKEAYQSVCDIHGLLEQLRLLEIQDQNASSLSGGQKQRLAFAMTLASGAKLVLLDEPFNNVDYKSYQLMLTCLQKQTDTTFFIISHQISVSREMGCNFILMNKGRVTFQGDKDSFFEQCSQYINDALRMV